MADEGVVQVDVFLGGAPLLQTRLCEGLIRFGQDHPRWRFSTRSADFRYRKRWLREQGISGVLVLIDAKPAARQLNAAGIPWVHLLPARESSYSSVMVDDLAIGSMGADFFLEKGFQRYAFCGCAMPWSNVRFRGFRDRLAENERECEFIDIPFQDMRDWGISRESEQLLVEWVKNIDGRLAVMAAHDVIANRLVDICQQCGLRVPQDIAVLGVGNHDLFCRLSSVPISSIDTGVPLVAVAGAEMLEQMLAGNATPDMRCVSPIAVQERRSTEILSYGDDLVAQVVTYIRDHACAKVRVDDILARFPVSRRTLSRRFEKYVGHSPAEEIRMARFKIARKMVLSGNLSLTDIAHTCGYADLSHMDRYFHLYAGKSPVALRNSGK